MYLILHSTEVYSIVQQTAAVQVAKFIRRLGILNAVQMGRIEAALAMVLGLTLADK